MNNEPSDRIVAEEKFHDAWAASEQLEQIDVRRRNEACTAPEMRFITQALGDISEKHLLDAGCGLGEASVYFALRGAHVTAVDVSPGMLEVTQRLAGLNGVTVETHVSSLESLQFTDGRVFDVIYLGNVFHHSHIPTALDCLLPLLKKQGVLVSWDPLAYNPIINLYRKLATEVRTEDEHPLNLREIRTIRERFENCEMRWFWLSTLIVFASMFVFQRRDPNKERYWKTVIDEADAWKWLYLPLEIVDHMLLKLLPFLGPFCWNVVLICKGPKQSQR